MRYSASRVKKPSIKKSVRQLNVCFAICLRATMIMALVGSLSAPVLGTTPWSAPVTMQRKQYMQYMQGKQSIQGKQVLISSISTGSRRRRTRLVPQDAFATAPSLRGATNGTIGPTTGTMVTTYGGIGTTIGPMIGTTGPTNGATNGTINQDEKDEYRGGLNFRLLEARPEMPAREMSLPVTENRPLSEAESAQLLQMLPPLKQSPANNFTLPPKTLHPPTAQTRVEQSFPPKEQKAPPANANAGALNVTNKRPLGLVNRATNVTISFSQPMVPVSSQEAVTAKGLPIKLLPALDGEWKWYGTQNLVFEPAKNPMPMSTEYSVFVPASIKSISGQQLESDVSWKFSTPTTHHIGEYPTNGNASVSPATLVMLRFNQRIQEADMIKAIKITAAGAKVEFRQATGEEVKQDALLTKQIAKFSAGTFVVIKPVAPLPSNSLIQVSVGPVIPSAEGPLLTRTVEKFNFRTYGPMELKDLSRQRVLPKPIPSREAMGIQFTNEIDQKGFNDSFVKVTPAVTELHTTIFNNSLYIDCRKQFRTTYKVELSSQIKDIFGQKLSGRKIQEFRTLPETPQMNVPQGMIVLPRKQSSVLPISTINLPSFNMSVYAVSAAQYLNCLNRPQSIPSGAKLLASKTIPCPGKPDQLHNVDVDLSPWLAQSNNLLIRCTSATFAANQTYKSCTWVQSTGIGIDAFQDGDKILVWATDILSGAAVAGAEVRLLPGNVRVRTDQAGLARLPLEKNGGPLVVQTSHDSAFVDSFSTRQLGSPERRPGSRMLRWYAISDRSPYRPGERVHIKGVIRGFRNAPNAELENVYGNVESVKCEVFDGRLAKFFEGKTDINAYGGFDLSFDIPKNANLGILLVQFEAQTKGKFAGNTYSYPLKGLEFRRPEFEVSLKNEGEPVQMIGSSALYSCRAAYLSTGAVQHAQVNWSAMAVPATYSPPGWSEYSFALEQSVVPLSGLIYGSSSVIKQLRGSTDSGGQHRVRLSFLGAMPHQPNNIELQATVQDVNRQTFSSLTTLLVHPSTLYVGLKKERFFGRKNEDLPLSLVVTDIDGKFQPGTNVKVEMYHPTYGPDDSTKVTKNDLQELQLTTTAAGDKPCQFVLHPKQSGDYTIHATVSDAQHRANECAVAVSIQGGESLSLSDPEAESFRAKMLTLTPEKDAYQPDETASILVQAPFAPAEGLATVWHNGLSKEIRFHADDKSYTLKIPVREADVPDETIEVDMVGSEKDKKGRLIPAEASGITTLKVSAEGNRLTVEAKPSVDKTEPGKEVSVDVAVKDRMGNAIADAEVTLAVVDDGLLSLAAYKFGDPIACFYASCAAFPEAVRTRPLCLVWAVPAREKLIRLQGATSGTIGPQGQDATYVTGVNTANSLGPIMSVLPRSNFDALATWVPSKLTDKDGHAVIKFKLPDNVTRYRVMAFAHAGAKFFGTGESTLVARMPLTIRPSAPRFLNFGDKFELPFVVQNKTEKPLSVRLAARGTNVKFTAGQGREFQVPANDRVEIRLPASTEESGTMHVQAVVVSGTEAVAGGQSFATDSAESGGKSDGSLSAPSGIARGGTVGAAVPGTAGAGDARSSGHWRVGEARDAAEFSIPVQLPASTEAFAAYGEIDQGSITQKVLTPDNVLPDYGALELTTSSTALATLTDAFIYLQHYPFECSEQISSRLISIALLKDMLTAFHAAGLPSTDQIAATVKADLGKLKSRQEQNGAFSLWQPGERHAYPYVTLHVVHGLLRLKNAGYDVPQSMLNRGLTYVRHIDSHLDSTYSNSCKMELRAFALYLRDLAKEKVAAEAARLLGKAGLEKVSPEVLAYLWPTFVHDAHSSGSVDSSNRIRQFFNNYVVETSSTAKFERPGSPSDYRMFDSMNREDALILDAMIINSDDGKDNQLVVKLLKSLLGGRRQGHWSNTQENAYVLLAMRHYFDKYEHVTPNFVASAWLGKDFIGESDFKGRSNEFKGTTVPMQYLLAHKSDQTGTDFSLEKKGEGRLYYRLAMSCAPKGVQLKSMNRGFLVERTYEGVRNKDDVYRDAEGNWHFKAGCLVRTKLKLSALSERYFVAFVDPLPAGTEALDSALDNSERVVTKDKDNHSDASPMGWWGGWWGWEWWTHENVRDNQVEVFADQLSGGSHEYSHISRATTPGVFVTPPAKAEEMYAPETFGRTGTEVIVVE